MNLQFDIIVIGDSKEGREAVKKLASANPTIKMAFVSREFKSTTTHDYLNVEYIKDSVTFTDYRNRLFGCYLESGDRLFCTHMIIASGLSYLPFTVNNKQVPCVFNNTDDIPKTAKNQPAVVIGTDNSDAKFALEVAKKYKHVYLCNKSISFEGLTPANEKKLNEASNIVVLPNTSVVKFLAEEDSLKKVELDSYSTINCSAIFVKTQATPETLFVSDKLIVKDDKGYLMTTNISQSSLVPKCFAIGSCASKSTKKMFEAMIENILNYFNGGTI
jgi:thioredoxin reductase